MHVLILGARAPACLEWARVFNAADWCVTIADSLAWPLTRSSRAAHAYVQLPEPRTNPIAWLEAVSDLVDTHKIDVILPTCEEAFYLASGIEKLSKQCRVITSNLSTMQRVHHKHVFAELTISWPIEAPETWLLETEDAVNAVSANAGELVFKPAYSRFARQALIKPEAKRVKKIKPNVKQPWVAQKFIAGREYCSYSLLIKGKLTAHACYDPLYRVGGGSGIYFQPVSQPLVCQFVEKFGAETGYTGQVGFDFIMSDDGKFYVLECNPRGTSGVHLFDDQPQKLVAALLEEQGDGILLPTNEPRMVSMAMLLFAAPYHVFDSTFWKNYWKARDVIMRLGDTRPFWAQVPSMFEIIYRALVQRRGLLAAATADIEWDGQPLVEEAL